MQRKDLIERAFKNCGVYNDTDGRERHKIRFPNFGSYVPPTKDEVHKKKFTKKEIEQLEAKEDQFQKELKAKKKRKRQKDLQERAKKRAKKTQKNGKKKK